MLVATKIPKSCIWFSFIAYVMLMGVLVTSKIASKSELKGTEVYLVSWFLEIQSVMGMTEGRRNDSQPLSVLNCLFPLPTLLIQSQT